MTQSQENAHLLALYQGRQVYHGEMHDHSASGGTSDGKCTLAHWREQLGALKMDFAAILDHRQIRQNGYASDRAQGKYRQTER